MDKEDFLEVIGDVIKQFSTPGKLPTGRIRVVYETRDGRKFGIEVEDDGKGGYDGKVIVWDKNGNSTVIFDDKITDDLFSDGVTNSNDPFAPDPLFPTDK